MSQDISKQKRRWFKKLLGGKTAAALCLAPALLMTSLSNSQVYGQVSESAPAQASVGADANFVVGWLDESARQIEAGNPEQSANAFAEALRARKLVGSSDAAVEGRLKEVEGLLLSKGMKKQQIIDAIGRLGAITPPPTAPVATPLPNQQSSRNPGAVVTAAGTNQAPIGASPTVFRPGQDTTSTQPASSQIELAPGAGTDLPTPTPTASPSDMSGGEELYRRGVELLGQGDREAAYDHFRRAWEYQGEMDVTIRNQLKDKLAAMQNIAMRGVSEASPLQQVSQEELAARQRMMSEVTGEIAAAEANREAEPEVVAERLQTLRTRVSQANLDANTRKQLLTIVDRQIATHQIYMTQNKAAIDQNMRNRQIEDQIALDRETRYKLDQQIASLVETYNDLMDEGNFMEAEVIAKQVGELDRNSTIASLLVSNARNARRIGEYEEIRQMKEDKFIDNMMTVDQAAVPFDDREPLIFDAKRWEEITRNRARQVRESQQGMSPAEMKIWDQLKQPVLVDFQQVPLSNVAKTLSEMTGVMIHIDEAGLALEGYNADTPVTLSLPSQISLRSALNLLLNTKNMDFQVRNEVLMITSARNTAQANVERVYSVKDLVIPIPNFVTDYNSGMAGALRQAYETIGRGLVAQKSAPTGLQGVASQLASHSVDPNSGVLGQINGLQGMGGGNLPPAIGGGFGLGGSSGPTMGGNMPPMSMGSPVQSVVVQPWLILTP